VEFIPGTARIAWFSTGAPSSCCSSTTSFGKLPASRLRRSACAVRMSVPGARPSPRSTRPGNSASSVPNCSAMTSGEWFGSMMPPEPMRIRFVAAPTWPMTTAVAALAMPGMP
jgi:hypothetical protein